MEQINTLELRDPEVYPDENVLKKILDHSYNTYLELLELFDKYELTHEWRYYKDGKAWLCKVQKKRKTFVWMSAWKGFVKATVYIPQKHIDGLFRLDLTEQTREFIKETRNVGKSKPCMFDITSTEPIEELEKVLIYKSGLK